MKKNYLVEKEMSVTVKDTDDDYDNLIGKLYMDARTKIFDELKKPVVQMEPKEFYIEEIQTIPRTAKGQIRKYFSPKNQMNYTIKATVVVWVRYINLSKEEAVCLK